MAFVATACSPASQAEFPVLTGRRVQATSVVGHSGGPYRVGAYELVFAGPPGAIDQERRAALVVDLAAGQGPVHGFVEWGRPGERPSTYTVGGWAQQRDVRGEVVTVFELALTSRYSTSRARRRTHATSRLAPSASSFMKPQARPR